MPTLLIVKQLLLGQESSKVIDQPIETAEIQEVLPAVGSSNLVEEDLKINERKDVYLNGKAEVNFIQKIHHFLTHIIQLIRWPMTFAADFVPRIGSFLTAVFAQLSAESIADMTDILWFRKLAFI